MIFLLSLSKRLFLYLVLFLIIVIGVLAGVYIATNSQASEAILEETMERQLALTKTGSIVISEFFNIAGNALVLVGQNYLLLDSEADRHALLNDYVARRKDMPIVGIAVLNEQGIVTDNHTFNQATGQAERNGPAQGVDLSDRDYMQWAMQAQPGQVHISDPIISRLGSSQEKEIVTITTPLFEHGRYRGAIVVPVLLEDFKDLYLDVLSQEETRTFLLDEQGVILTSANDQQVGKNAFDLMTNPLIDVDYYHQKFNESLANNQAGVIDVIVPLMPDWKLTRSLISHAPIQGFPNSNQKWMLVIISPVDAALSGVAPIYIQQITLLVAIFFALLFMVLTVTKVIQIKN